MDNNYLVYFEDLDGYKGKALITGFQLIKMKDESDFTNREITRVFDVTDPDKKTELHYVGWQPNCLIEFANKLGNVVVRGYGIDH